MEFNNQKIIRVPVHSKPDKNTEYLKLLEKTLALSMGLVYQ